MHFLGVSFLPDYERMALYLFRSLSVLAILCWAFSIELRLGEERLLFSGVVFFNFVFYSTSRSFSLLSFSFSSFSPLIISTYPLVL